MRCSASGQGAFQSSPPEPNESFFDSRLQELSGVRDPKLFHHIRSVRLDGFDADLQASADLAVLQAAGNEVQDLRLARAQAVRLDVFLDHRQLLEAEGGT